MLSIDIHAYLKPECFCREVQSGGLWHGLTSPEVGLGNLRNSLSPLQRMQDMDSPPRHMLSTITAFEIVGAAY